MPSQKIIFVFERINQNKWFAPLIDEALSRKLEVECWLDLRDISHTTKWYERPDREKMPVYRNGTPVFHTFEGPDKLAERTAQVGPCIIFSDRAPKAPKPKGQIWAHVVTSYYDSFAGMLPSELCRFDLIFCTSQHWIDASLKFYVLSGRVPEGAPELADLRKRTRATGIPQFDHFALIDKGDAKEKLGFPRDKKIVTVYAFEPGCTFWATYLFQVPSLLKRMLYILVLPFSYPRFFTKVGRSKLLSLCWLALAEKPKFLRAAFFEPTDLDVLKAIREFCDRNDYAFVLKYRKKYPPLGYQLGIADKEIFEDTDFYPYSSALVIAASDLLISSFSTSMGEAAFCSVPAVNLHPDDVQLQLRDQFRLIYKGDTSALAHAYDRCVHDLTPGAFYNSPGVVWDMSFNEFCAHLPKQTLDDFVTDPQRQTEYRKKFIQEEEGPTAPRILDLALREQAQLS